MARSAVAALVAARMLGARHRRLQAGRRRHRASPSPRAAGRQRVFLLVIALTRREPFAWTPPVRRLAALGVLNLGIAYALGLIGLTTITASSVLM